jgi:hypothetical protein
MHMPVDSALSVAAVSKAVHSLLAAMECWSCEHRTFAVERFFKNDDSSTQTNMILGSTSTLEETVRF